MTKPLYLDWNATTPLHPKVLEIMDFYFKEEFGNAGSRTHVYGLEAKKGVNKAREQIAQVVSAEPNEVIFTSGATESNNLSILGLEKYGKESNKLHILTSPIEHKAVLEPIRELERRGFDLEILSMDKSGRIDPADLEMRLRDDTLLVSIMQVNNENGIRQPIHECAELLKKSDAYFHVDAAQGFGKELPPLKHSRIDLISCSSHKIQGPMGIGSLITSKRKYRRPPLTPLFFGGGQENGLRPGTLAVPLIAGFGMAAEILTVNNISWWEEKQKIKLELLSEIKDSYQFVGDQQFAMPNCFSLIFDNWDSEAYLLAHKDDWALSNGSACTSDKITPSHVLKAMGLNAVKGGIRFSY